MSTLFDVLSSTLTYDRTVAPNDHMWNTGARWYFDVGVSALACIRHALDAAGVPTPSSILDMPCGHGRVCRMLRAAYPDAYLAACDLDRDGVDFCARTFGAHPVYSHEDVRRVTLDRGFDLIWCGSLLTHVERDRWPHFLGFFADHLNLDGVLVFTTHGRQPIQWMIDGFFHYGLSEAERHRLIDGYLADGFAFVKPAGQPFGTSVSAMSFVCGLVERIATLKLVTFQEAGWAGHQDAIACMRLRTPFHDPAVPRVQSR